MKAVVIYDTNFGNTKKIAEAIAEGIGKGTRALQVSKSSPKDIKGMDILVVGSPIMGFRPSEKMLKYLSTLEPNQLNGIKAASFDTRVKIFVHGDAAKKISKKLEAAGADIISEPQAFYVKGKEGPLFDSELEKAGNWGKRLNELSR